MFKKINSQSIFLITISIMQLISAIYIYINSTHIFGINYLALVIIPIIVYGIWGGWVWVKAQFTDVYKIYETRVYILFLIIGTFLLIVYLVSRSPFRELYRYMLLSLISGYFLSLGIIKQLKH